MKRAISWILAITLALALTACTPSKKLSLNKDGLLNMNVEKNPIVTITMEDDSKIKVELYPDKAPNTVCNFISLVNKQFYDGVVFHRIIDGFMIQGGDPDGTGRGGPGYMIKGEFANNGFKGNDIKHVPGVISMARSPLRDSAGSQFFIMVGTSSHLDGEYAAFGKVVDEGSLAVVKKLAKLPVGGPNGDAPKNPPKMKTVTVDTFGYEYPEPQTIKR